MASANDIVNQARAWLGNGEDRKNNLTNAGYNYAEVQSRVNAILNGVDRKNRLTASGYDYYTVQTIVNNLL